MAINVIRRLGQSAVTLMLASLVVFIGVRQIPGDPAIAMAGEEATPEMLAAIREQLGLDRPLLVQYLTFVGDFITGRWGDSTRTGEPVAQMVASTLPVTIALAACAAAIAVVAGIVMGTVAERFRGRWPEWGASGTALLLLSVPSFWLGLLAILVFSVQLRWFPSSGFDDETILSAIVSLTLPALVLSTALAATIIRQTRAALIVSMRSDYVRTARAKGLSPARVLLTYGLRNSLIVVVTIIGLQFGALISGAVVTEQVFGLPGFGKLILNAVLTRDYPVVQAAVLVITFAVIVINFAVDVLYTAINPRIRVGARA